MSGKIATADSVRQDLENLEQLLSGSPLGKTQAPPRDICNLPAVQEAYEAARARVAEIPTVDGLGDGKRLSPARRKKLVAPFVGPASKAVEAAWSVLTDKAWNWAAEEVIALHDETLAALRRKKNIELWARWDAGLGKAFSKAKEIVAKAYGYEGKYADALVGMVYAAKRYCESARRQHTGIARKDGLPISVMFSGDGVECPYLDALVEAGVKVGPFLAATVGSLTALDGIGKTKAKAILAARDAAVAAKEGKSAEQLEATDGGDGPVEEAPAVVETEAPTPTAAAAVVAAEEAEAPSRRSKLFGGPR